MGLFMKNPHNSLKFLHNPNSQKSQPDKNLLILQQC
jgi:hypothetical protein